MVNQLAEARTEVARIKVDSNFQEYEISDVRYEYVQTIDSLRNAIQHQNDELSRMEAGIRMALKNPLPQILSTLCHPENNNKI